MRVLLAISVVFVMGCEDLSVSTTTPLSDATGVARDTKVEATLSAAIDTATFDATSFRLETGGSTVSCARSTDADATTLTLLPSSLLEAGTKYTATLTTAITDTSGAALPSDYSWSFTTEGAGGAGGNGGGTGGNAGGSAGGTAGGSAGGTAGGMAGGAGGGSAGSGGSGTCRTYATAFTVTTTGGVSGTTMDTHSQGFDTGTLRLTDTYTGGNAVWRYASVAKFVDEAAFLHAPGGAIDAVITGASGSTTITASYDGQGRRTGFATSTTTSQGTFPSRNETYTAWDTQGRETAGTFDSLTPLGAGESCTGLSVTFSYNDATRTVTRVDSGGTTHSANMIDWCTPSHGTRTTTYDSRFIVMQSVSQIPSGTITDTWSVTSTAQVCK